MLFNALCAYCIYAMLARCSTDCWLLLCLLCECLVLCVGWGFVMCALIVCLRCVCCVVYCMVPVRYVFVVFVMCLIFVLGVV